MFLFSFLNLSSRHSERSWAHNFEDRLTAEHFYLIVGGQLYFNDSHETWQKLNSLCGIIV